MTFDYVVADSKNIVISARVPVQLFIASFADVQKNSNRYFWSFVVCANFLLAFCIFQLTKSQNTSHRMARLNELMSDFNKFLSRVFQHAVN